MRDIELYRAILGLTTPWTRYHDEHGQCVYCDMLNEELRAGKRIVQETDTLVCSPLGRRSRPGSSRRHTRPTSS